MIPPQPTIKTNVEKCLLNFWAIKTWIRDWHSLKSEKSNYERTLATSSKIIRPDDPRCLRSEVFQARPTRRRPRTRRRNYVSRLALEHLGIPPGRLGLSPFRFPPPWLDAKLNRNYGWINYFYRQLLLTCLSSQVASEDPQSTTAEGDEDEEEESHVSEGQLVQGAPSYSDDSDISEEIIEGRNVDH